MADTIPVIWGQTSDGKDAYVKTCTAGVYNPATGKTIDQEMAICIPDGGENLPPTPIDVATLQKLWDNPSPDESSFNGQTINIDLSSYNAVGVLCYYSSQFNNNEAFSIIPLNTLGNVTIIMLSGTSVFGRGCTANSRGVTFGNGTDATKVIPMQIYGIQL